MEKILSYPLPKYTDLPKSAANWLPDRHRTALLIHDMQKYFVDFFETEASPINSVIRNTHTLLSIARNFNIPVFYTAQPGSMTPEQRGLLKIIWGEGMKAKGEHREIIPLLTPIKDETVLTKWRYSAFVKSNLLHHLRDLNRNQLIICGVYAHIGCLATAIDAYSHDIETFFVSDAVADFSEEKHRIALNIAAEICSVVASTEQIIANLKK
ncbi:isochorismatase family protein [Photorhabdus heterorhabditis]|uniref:2,3-dihydro-2,3-dihydroxybenzoate synthetase n=1 Tax=Photorhabdus heterorhabditis TaxID=880156 RepID=A0ABR5KED7_9GAMM|nr:isochorismatase family protein [Photorhabdus heterorhabditis]KOY62754.1 2,3-dihydro-2,3-dihydroxybenzoate synthetase [Photorhabdus heterorhabditis]MBS9442070.1 isochorismatase family protein [Photorhabdus heterorhabditis]